MSNIEFRLSAYSFFLVHLTIYAISAKTSVKDFISIINIGYLAYKNESTALRDREINIIKKKNNFWIGEKYFKKL